jgi:hypothetical protein
MIPHVEIPARKGGGYSNLPIALRRTSGLLTSIMVSKTTDRAYFDNTNRISNAVGVAPNGSNAAFRPNALQQVRSGLVTLLHMLLTTTVI